MEHRKRFLDMPDEIDYRAMHEAGRRAGRRATIEHTQTILDAVAGGEGNALNLFGPAELMELVAVNPLVYRVFNQWRSGKLTWEQAMVGAILMLAFENKRLMELLVLGQTPPQSP